MPLQVLIAGGGIAGLASALSLRRAGHDVTIHERSRRFDNEVGAAVHIPPNATRPLLAWGLDPRRARFVGVERSRFRDGRTLETLREAEHDNLEGSFGAPFFAAHRVDLHEELRRLAFAEDQDGRWGKIRVVLGSEVVGYDPDAPAMTLASGEVLAADLVVAADGIHSRAPRVLAGRSDPARPAGEYNYCYRFLIPRATLEADPATRWWNAERENGMMKYFVDNPKRMISYTCRNHEVHNFVGLFHKEGNVSMDQEDWHKSVAKAKVLETFHDFHPKLLEVIDKATECKVWPLLYRAPLSTWIRGRMAVAGDAAHPMLPFQGQGGAQAIEDAVALGIAMTGASSAEAVPERLGVYDRIRRNRGSVLQVLSNAGQDEAHKVAIEAAQYIPADTVPMSPEECAVFNFSYDVIRDSVDKVRDVEPDFALPSGFFAKEPNPAPRM